mmetsp:Transcript_17614/g.37972  ORF Transcript_17614/g.37972 Transcript_17614/m.37972 type:complete len:235 (-) Transcript_17614:574-1278(-)
MVRHGGALHRKEHKRRHLGPPLARDVHLLHLRRKPRQRTAPSLSVIRCKQVDAVDQIQPLRTGRLELLDHPAGALHPRDLARAQIVYLQLCILADALRGEEILRDDVLNARPRRAGCAEIVLAITACYQWSQLSGPRVLGDQFERHFWVPEAAYPVHPRGHSLDRRATARQHVLRQLLRAQRLHRPFVLSRVKAQVRLMQLALRSLVVLRVPFRCAARRIITQSCRFLRRGLVP